jgi:hypothetical protein
MHKEPIPTKSPALRSDTAIHEENVIQYAPSMAPTAAVDVPAPAPASALMITLTEPVSIQTESGTVTLPVGTKLEFVSQLNTKVHVHYLNSDHLIPISATDLKRKPPKTAK